VVSEAFEVGRALFAAVGKLGFEGVVAKGQQHVQLRPARVAEDHG
jgi:hypothetical protein